MTIECRKQSLQGPKRLVVESSDCVPSSREAQTEQLSSGIKSNDMSLPRGVYYDAQKERFQVERYKPNRGRVSFCVKRHGIDRAGEIKINFHKYVKKALVKRSVCTQKALTPEGPDKDFSWIPTLIWMINRN